MKKEGGKQKGVPEMPFQVDRNLGVNVATQVTDGIREAILTGFYKPGDVLPKIMEFTRGLHVSLRALLPAYRTLKREGLISPRRSIGTVVVGPKADVFHGRVVIVNQGHTPAYYDAVANEVITRRLSAAGYVVGSVSVIPLGKRRDDPGEERFDVRQLNAALRQKTSLAVIMGTIPSVERAVAATGTPFFTIGSIRSGASGCVGSASSDPDSDLPCVLEWLRERNVRSLVQVGIRQADLLDSEALRGACESYEELAGWPRHVKNITLDAIVRTAFDIFRKRYRTKADLPDAFLFTDDYLARGALMALLGAGIRTGRDVLVISLALKGNAPLHADPIDLLLRDPDREANIIADALVAYLDSGVAPGTIALESTFVAGE